MEKIIINIDSLITDNIIRKKYYLALCQINGDAVSTAKILLSSGIIDNILSDETLSSEQYEKCNAISNQLTALIFKNENSICECGTKMEILEDTSEMECPYCFRIVTLTGIVFRKNQLHSQSNNNHIKSNSYMPIKHFNDCIKYIQGTNETTIPDEIIAELRKKLKRDKMLDSQLNCSIIRQYLSECGHINVQKTLKSGATKMKKEKCSIYKNSAPKILWILTDDRPPMLTSDEFKQILYKFNLLIKIHDEHLRLKAEKNNPNRPHYFYFIYKIIDQELINSENQQKFLENIHMQSDSTIAKNDKKFKDICKHLTKRDGIIFKPTILKR